MSKWTPSSLQPWLETRYARSSGPGGQHVNKVETRVTILFDFNGCDFVTAWEKRRIRTLLHTRLSHEGWLRVSCQVHRSQARNRVIALERLIELLQQVTFRQKKRIATKPSAGSKRRRLSDKKKRSEIKNQRSRRVNHDG